MTELHKLRDHPTYRGGIGFYHKNPTSNNSGFFALSGARLNPTRAADPTGQHIRCDSASYGPYGYHTWDEELQVCNCGSSLEPDPSMGHHQIVLSNVEYVSTVVEALPYGYVLYFELWSKEDEEECIRQRHSDCAMTLQEIFRLMLEWDYAYRELDNRESIAVSCHGMVNTLEIPESIISWLWSLPEEKVSKFINNDPLAQEPCQRTLVPDLSVEFDDWVCKKIMNSRPIGSYR
jgi:hypothetical protein